MKKDSQLTIAQVLDHSRSQLVDIESQAIRLGVQIKDGPPLLIGGDGLSPSMYADYLLKRFYDWNSQLLALEDHLEERPHCDIPARYLARALGRRCHAWYERQKMLCLALGLQWHGDQAYIDLVSRALNTAETSAAARRWLERLGMGMKS